MNKCIALTIFVIFSSISVYSQNALQSNSESSRPNGHWSGWIERGNQRYDISMELKESEGKWVGEFEMPSMGYQKHDLLGVKVQNNPQKQITISLPLPVGSLKLLGTFAGSAFIKGTLEPVTLVKGQWKSLGIAGAFEMRRGQKPELPYEIHEVGFSNGGINLSGSLYLPKGNGPFPAAVFISGSGDAKRGEGGFISDRLARAGIAVLAYDKRGVGSSTGNWKSASFDDLGSDATAALEALRKFQKIDSSKIGLICQSQGCWIAPIAVRNGAKVNLLVSMSAPAVTVSDEHLDYYKVTLEAGGFSSSDINKAFELVRTDQAVSLGLKTWAELQAVIEKYQSEGWFRFLKYEPMTIDNPLRAFQRKTALYDPQKDLNSLPIPSLWLYGTSDKIIPVAESIARIKQLRSKIKPEVIILNGADHSLTVWLPEKLPEAAENYPLNIINWIKTK